MDREAIQYIAVQLQIVGKKWSDVMFELDTKGMDEKLVVDIARVGEALADVGQDLVRIRKEDKEWKS